MVRSVLSANDILSEFGQFQLEIGPQIHGYNQTLCVTAPIASESICISFSIGIDIGIGIGIGKGKQISKFAKALKKVKHIKHFFFNPLSL